MVPALFAELPRPGGDDGGAWPVGGSRHDLALGPAICPDSESASASRTSASQSFLAGGRNVRPGRRRLDVPLSRIRSRPSGLSAGADRDLRTPTAPLPPQPLALFWILGPIPYGFLT